MLWKRDLVRWITGASCIPNWDTSFRGGAFEVTGANANGREPGGDRIMRLGLRMTF